MIEFLQLLLLVAVLTTLWQKALPELPLRRPSSRKMILDTCALIDGRILELVHSGFVPDQLVVPEFVVHELQLLADSSDAQKRDRARYGLDVVKELQDSQNSTVVIDRTLIEHKHATDDKLVALAKKLQAPLYTTDFNLNKVAEIEGVRVLNVNELAQHLRPTALPGEKKTVKIVQKGSSAKQGVGYLEDGTMVVVEDAASKVGKSVTTKITRVHQTAAGKMLFGGRTRKPQSEASASSKPRLAVNRSAKTLAQRMKRQQIR